MVVVDSHTAGLDHGCINRCNTAPSLSLAVSLSHWILALAGLQLKNPAGQKFIFPSDLHHTEAHRGHMIEKRYQCGTQIGNLRERGQQEKH